MVTTKIMIKSRSSFGSKIDNLTLYGGKEDSGAGKVGESLHILAADALLEGFLGGQGGGVARAGTTGSAGGGGGGVQLGY